MKLATKLELLLDAADVVEGLNHVLHFAAVRNRRTCRRRPGLAGWQRSLAAALLASSRTPSPVSCNDDDAPGPEPDRWDKLFELATVAAAAPDALFQVILRFMV